MSLYKHVFAAPFPQDMAQCCLDRFESLNHNLFESLNHNLFDSAEFPKTYSSARTELSPYARHGFAFKLCGRLYVMGIGTQYYKRLHIC